MISAQEFYDLHYERFHYQFVKIIGREPTDIELRDILAEEYQLWRQNRGV